MKRTIRKGCFETNSSSMHSIVITNIEGKSENGNYYANKNNQVSFFGSEIEFGRSPFEILHTFYDKVRYAIAAYKDDDNMIQEIENIFYIVTGNTLDIPYETEEIYRREDTHEIVPCYETEWSSDDDDAVRVLKADHSVELETKEIDVIAGWGIDHESQGLLQGFLKEKGITLKEFLTNSKYMVIIDGDEYWAFENILKSGIVDTSKIVEQYPKEMSYESYLWRKGNEED